MGTRQLLNRIAGQVFIRLRKLRELGLVIELRIRDLESAGTASDVSLNVADTCNLGQIASDRGGTAPSVHVRDLEADIGRIRIPGFGGLRNSGRRIGDRRGATATNHTQQCDLTEQDTRFHGWKLQ